jgi:hypothetical protein
MDILGPLGISIGPLMGNNWGRANLRGNNQERRRDFVKHKKKKT